MRGKSLLCRKRDWYDQRRYEVADRWMLELIDRLRARGGKPAAGDLFRVLDLTSEQIAGLNALPSAPYVSDDDRLTGIRELLAVLKASPADADAPLPAGSLAVQEALPPALT